MSTTSTPPALIDWGWFESRELRVVLGPPGTGKTRRLVEEAAAAAGSGESTLLIAFNVSARDEAAGRGVPSATLHSLAVRAARELGLTLPSAERGGADVAINRMRALAAKRHGLPYSMNPFITKAGNKVFHAFDYAVHAFGEAWARHVPPPALPTLASYVERLRRGGFVDFTTAVLAAASGEAGTVIPVDVLLIDEAQDLSPLMWRAVTRLFEPRRVVVAGDDDQAIYGELHAASPAVLQRLAELSGGAEVLRESHRVPAAVHAAAEAVIGRTRRIPKHWSPRPERGSVSVIEGGLVSAAVRGVGDGSVAVITRTNEAALTVLRAFLARGFIPGVLKRPEPPILRAAREVLRSGETRVIGRRNKAAIQSLLREVRRRGEEEVVTRGAASIPVTVDTVHQFKGREADTVIIVNMIGSRRWRARDAEEELRLIYVAATRARKRLVIYENPRARKWFDEGLLGLRRGGEA